MHSLQSLSELFIPQLIQVTLVILLALMLDTFLVRMRSSQIRYVLWLLVLFKLVTPPLFASPTGIFSLAMMTYEVPVDQNDIIATSWLTNFQTSLYEHPRLPAYAIACWLSGVAILSFVWVGRMRRVGAGSTQPSDQLARCNQLVSELCESLHVAKLPEVRITESSFGPAVFGLFQPTIVLPRKVLEHVSDAELRPVLAHELIHIKRRDTWVGLLQLIAAVLWWFHPLAWIAIRRLSDSLELATDEDVVAQTEFDEHCYAGSLLAVISAAHLTPPVTGTVGVFTCQVTELRIRRLITSKLPRPRPLLSLALAILLACLILPGRGLVIVGNTFDANDIPDVECPYP